MVLPLDPRETAFVAFNADRPDGHKPLSGWERACFIRGWDAAEAEFQKQAPKKWWQRLF